MRRLKRMGNIVLIFMLIFMNFLSPVSLIAANAETEPEQRLIFEADFNDDIAGEAPSDFNVLEDGGTVQVVDIPDAENKSVFLDDTSEENFVLLEKRFDDLTGVVTVEMRFMQPSYTNHTKIMRLKGDGNSVALETSDGHIGYRKSDDTHIPVVEVEDGKWYDIKIEVNLNEKTSNVYIDEVLELKDAELYSQASKINIFETFTPGGGAKGHYVDDIKVSQLIAPEVPEVPEIPDESTIVFEEDFNDDVVGEEPKNMDSSEAGGTVSVVDVPDSDNKSVFLDDTSDSTNVIISKSFEDISGVATVEMKFMQPAYISSTKVMRLKGDGTSIIIETNGGDITYRTGNDYEPLVELEENVWYEIKVEVDLENQTADVFIDDELKLEGAGFNEQASKINFFESFTPNSGTKGHYVDDIIVSGILAEDESPDQPEAPEADGEGGIYEAEYAEFEAAIIDNKHVGFTGTGFVDYSPNAPGGWIEWTVNVPVDGEYNLDFRYAHGGTDLRPKDIFVNGDELDSELAFDPTGDFATWEYSSTKAFLQAGENKIRAVGNAPSGGANIDHLKVYMEYDEIYEAEESHFEEGVIIDNKHVGFTGTGFIDFSPNQPGTWIEFTVDVPIEEEYNLDFKYASGGTDLRPAEIKVNGDVIDEELAFDPTGDWATWVYSTTKATLQPGENIIRLTGVGASGGANIDHLRVHNTTGDSDSGPIDIENSDLLEIVSGLELMKLNEIGIIIESDSIDENQSMTRIEFMSLVNDAFGFVKIEKFKNLSTETNVWEVSLDEWYTYVLEAAKEAGYMEGLIEDNKVNPDQIITVHEAEMILANLQVESAGSENDQPLTWGEAKELIEPFQIENQNENVHIVNVQALSNHVIAITLDSYFEEFEYADLEVVVPTRNWAVLSPGFKNLQIDKAAKGTNKFGQTVLVLNSLDEWDEHGEYKQEVEEPTFQGNIDDAIVQADNLLTWQMDHGGWTKNWPHIYTRPWNGSESKSEWVNNGVDLGTIDNDATIIEILFLAQVYQETGEEKYLESIEKGFEFLFNLQYPTGGFAQVYPSRGGYSDYVTFNDEAMVNVLELMEDILENRYPFNNDIVSDEYMNKMAESLDKGIDYILKAQIEVDGVLTAWGQQHHPVTYEPMEARAYELVSISASESVGITRFLMSRPQTNEIKQSVLAALEWFEESKLEGIRYVSGDPNEVYFVEDPNSTAWYRFYEIGTNKPIFSDRDGVKKHEIMEIGEERRNGYAWGGHWATQLLNMAQLTGDYTNKVFVQVADTNSTDTFGRTLVADAIKEMNGEPKQIDEIENEITVAQDGSGDYETVQAAIDAVPTNNQKPVTIHIKDGIYKEVVTVPNNKPFITIIGESETDTIITYDNYAGRDNGVGGTLGTSGSASVFLRASDFRAENLTFENSFDESMDVEGHQAVAAYASGERMYFKNVTFIGNQDTLYTHSGTQYYNQVYVEGDVDFIFGGARAVFEDSIIHSLDRGSETNNGYITAASTSINDPYGILILNSKLTSDAAPGTVYLGRPWQSGGNPNNVASVVFMNSELGEHIHELGWTSMSGFQPENARLFEYNNTGPGAVINESRRQLTDEEAQNWTVENVLNGWNPNGEDSSPDPDPEPDPDDKVYEEIELVNEDFENVDIGTWPNDFDVIGDIGEVVELDGVGKVLHFPASGNNNGFIKAFEPQTGLVVAELDFMQPIRSNATVVLVLADDSGNDVIRVEAREHHFSSRLSDNSFEISSVENINELWRNVQVVADIDSQSFDLYIDGEIVFENQQFHQEGANIAQIKSITPGSSVRDHYIDNLIVTALIEVSEEPGDGEPGDGDPGDGDPGDGDPGDGDPGDGDPGDGDPGDGDPGDGDPGDGDPGDGDPGDGEPGDGEPGDGDPGDGDPGDGEPGDGEPGDGDSDKPDDTDKPGIDQDKQGEELPKTATANYNLLLSGFVLMILGGTFIMFYRYKKRKY